MSLILSTDGYKLSHWLQYPPNTEFVDSYFESRGGAWPYTIVAGTTPIVRSLLETPVTQADLDEAIDFVGQYMGPNVLNVDGWKHIINKHGGYAPVTIHACREGRKVPTHGVLMRVMNTDPAVPWITNYLETRLSHVWYPMTVATLSSHCRQIILNALERSGDPAGIDFKLQDFRYRGSTSEESSAIGGMGLLMNFKGTDTLSALRLIRKYYSVSMAGGSIPAAEHSTISSWMREGHRLDGEVAAYKNMLYSYPTGLVAVVSDTDDIFNACEHIWGELLRDDVLKRDGVLVIRPDSGYPPEVVLKCIRILDAKFGTTVNAKGYRVLNDKVRVIQGDGVDPQMIDMVLSILLVNNYSADNIAFGMGGALLQKVNRDTLKFAFKCCGVVIGGTYYPVFKKPMGDSSKRSQAGPLKCYVDDEIIYHNGTFGIAETFDVIRQRTISETDRQPLVTAA